MTITVQDKINEIKKEDLRSDIKALVNSCRFKIGTTYTNRKGQFCEIVDFHLTFDGDGEWTDTRYVVAHKLMGNDVLEHGICDTTIARALWKVA